MFHCDSGINEDCSCSKCLSGLTCSEDNICVIDAGTCASHKWTKPKALWTPCCDEKTGDYCPKQCKGDYTSGRCFCYSAKGLRIFGSSWWKNAANMTCGTEKKLIKIKISVQWKKKMNK